MAKAITAFYEDYDTPKAKRKAQKGAKRGKRTNQANGYISVAWCNGLTPGKSPCVDALVSVSHQDPGAGPTTGIASSGVSLDYLRDNCRRIARNEVPNEWLAVLKWDDEK